MAGYEISRNNKNSFSFRFNNSDVVRRYATYSKVVALADFLCYSLEIVWFHKHQTSLKKGNCTNLQFYSYKKILQYCTKTSKHENESKEVYMVKRFR